MGNNGLIDPKPGFSPACCFSGPVQCPAAAPVAYEFSITAATVYKGITGFSDCRAARARWQREVACPLPVQTLARGQCRRPPAVPASAASPQPANADGTRRSAQGSPKHASMPDGDDQSSRTP